MADIEMRQTLNEDGELVGDDPGLDTELLKRLYRTMVLTRALDRRMLALQRQGRIGTYPMLEGQEAVQVGSALALRADDFIFPSYREHGVQIARGLPLEVLMAYWRGRPNSDWDVLKYRQGIVTVPIASQIPHAVGYAYGARLLDEPAVSIVYFGDGATSESDFHAGMNFAGVWKTPTVFLCSNNHYAISVPYHKQTASETVAQKAIAYGMESIRVDGMDPIAMYLATTESLERARSGGGPTLIEAVTYRYGAHATADDARLYRDEDEEEQWRTKDPIPRMERYLNSRDLLDMDGAEKIRAEIGTEVDAAIEAVERAPLPGRDDAIRNAFSRIPHHVVDQLHDFQAAKGESPTVFSADETWEIGNDQIPSGETTEMTMADAINTTLHEAMGDDPSVLVLGEDIGQAGGVFRITNGLIEKFGEDRVIDTPLNESGIVGTAVGMAMAGLRPIAEIQFDGFVYPAFDQIVSHLGRMRYRTRGYVTLPVVVRWPNGAGIGAHEHHCDSPEAYFAHAPGIVVICPSTPTDAKGLLTAAILSDDPVVFLEPKVLYRAFREEVPTDKYTIPIGSARIRTEGDDLTLVTYGGMVPVCLRAAKASDASIEVIDLRTLFPWDRETVISSVEKTGRLLVVQEPQGTASISSDVAAVVAQEAMYSLECPIQRVTGFDSPWPQFAIEGHALIDDERVSSAIASTLVG
ncbi:MAG: pyruvate dehydrogenase (acetyl-transferring) E1 component subunit alpha [Acidimicrobiia bacterium]|nr:pyruvate dehydrogenase (acetyl-transferring) E1 component subunit alpha [Acidimicrobiia bacterium]